MDSLIASLSQFGIAGLMFVMWWIERTEKFKQKKGKEEGVLQALQNNTVVMTELRDEIRELKEKK